MFNKGLLEEEKKRNYHDYSAILGRAFFYHYKEGGNVTTLHNARKDVFATEEDKDRFKGGL